MNFDKEYDKAKAKAWKDTAHELLDEFTKAKIDYELSLLAISEAKKETTEEAKPTVDTFAYKVNITKEQAKVISWLDNELVNMSEPPFGKNTELWNISVDLATTEKGADAVIKVISVLMPSKKISYMSRGIAFVNDQTGNWNFLVALRTDNKIKNTNLELVMFADLLAQTNYSRNELDNAK